MRRKGKENKQFKAAKVVHDGFLNVGQANPEKKQTSFDLFCTRGDGLEPHLVCTMDLHVYKNFSHSLLPNEPNN